MSATISHFETLRQRFPTWPEFRAHIESKEGGALRVVEPAAGDTLSILRYVKGQSNFATADLGTGLFRSVVWDTAMNLPVCVAPPKAQEGLPPLNVQLATVENFVDGFMVNAFLRAGTLHVATRTSIGGANKFYSEKTFGQLFDEALATTPLKDRAGLAAALAQAAPQDAAATAIFASFVVQHPEHRIVAKVLSPSLNVVHLGWVTSTGSVTLAERPVTWPQELARLQVISYPTKLFRTEKEVEDLLRQQSVQRGWRWQGLVFKDGLGGRWRQRTPTYTMLRELRGAEATTEDRFLRLRTERKIDEYLKHYNEDRSIFWGLEQRLRARTADILAAYVDVHKAHAVSFKDLPAAYQPAVFLLHAKWRDELRERGFTVRLQNAIAVVNGMRDFEQRRLLVATPYQPVAPAPATTAGQDQEPADTATEQEPMAQEVPAQA